MQDAIAILLAVAAAAYLASRAWGHFAGPRDGACGGCRGCGSAGSPSSELVQINISGPAGRR